MKVECQKSKPLLGIRFVDVCFYTGKIEQNIEKSSCINAIDLGGIASLFASLLVVLIMSHLIKYMITFIH